MTAAQNTDISCFMTIFDKLYLVRILYITILHDRKFLANILVLQKVKIQKSTKIIL
jgi:hypothetical protein